MADILADNIIAGTNITNGTSAALVLGGNMLYNAGATSYFGTYDNQNLIIRTNNADRINILLDGRQAHAQTAVGASSTFITYTQANHTTGIQAGYLWNAGTLTGQTASSEVTDINFNLSATKTWATGAITLQRDFRIQARTHAFAGTSTITTASTLAISGPPIAGTNATITNSYALYIESGLSRYAGSIIIGGTNVTNSSVALEINSTTQAFVLPRMTTVQKNALTATVGMMVYDTTAGAVSTYNGSIWI